MCAVVEPPWHLDSGQSGEEFLQGFYVLSRARVLADVTLQSITLGPCLASRIVLLAGTSSYESMLELRSTGLWAEKGVISSGPSCLAPFQVALPGGETQGVKALARYNSI